MQTWEIREKIEQNNYCISKELYMEIIETSYQILQVRHILLGDIYHLVTSDGYDVKFKINWENKG